MLLVLFSICIVCELLTTDLLCIWESTTHWGVYFAFGESTTHWGVYYALGSLLRIGGVSVFKIFYTCIIFHLKLCQAI